MSKPYEAVKIKFQDYERARAIPPTTGLFIIDAIGAALEGWPHVPKRVRDQIVRKRIAARQAGLKPIAT